MPSSEFQHRVKRAFVRRGLRVTYCAVFILFALIGVQEVVTDFFRNVVVYTQAVRHPDADTANLAGWGIPGFTLASCLALGLCMWARPSMRALAGVVLLIVAFLALAILWHMPEMYQQSKTILPFNPSNPYSLDPTLFIVLPLAAIFAWAVLIEQLAHRFCTTKPQRRLFADPASLVIWLTALWAGIGFARMAYAPTIYLLGVRGELEALLPILWGGLIVVFALAAILVPPRLMSVRNKLANLAAAAVAMALTAALAIWALVS
jgi:hypothetical protein